MSQDEITDARSRLVSGLKRYFRSKRFQGLLSVKVSLQAHAINALSALVGLIRGCSAVSISTAPNGLIDVHLLVTTMATSLTHSMTA